MEGMVTRSRIAGLVSDDGCHVGRKVFTDPEVYAAEKRSIFGRSWLYLAHESQLPNAGDFVTTTMAETPVIVARGLDGTIRAHANSCSHRGLPVCRVDFGNARGFVCPYHAWTYDLAGALVAVPQERKAGRIDKSRLGLPPVPRVESYRGFVFGNFDPHAETLVDYLGDMRFYLDVYLDRFPGGVAPRPRSASRTRRHGRRCGPVRRRDRSSRRFRRSGRVPMRRRPAREKSRTRRSPRCI